MNAAEPRESSPDPLILSLNSTYAMRPSLSPSKKDVNSSPQKYARALRESSPNIPKSPTGQQQTLVFSTPTKGRKGNLGSSPWRIRVTVQAEPENGGVDGGLGVGGRTTIIPLKGEDEQNPVKRRSSRVRDQASSGSKSGTPGNAGSRATGAAFNSKRRKPSILGESLAAGGEDVENDGLIQAESPVSARKTPAKRRKSDRRSKTIYTVSPQDEAPTIEAPMHDELEKAQVLEPHLLWKPDVEGTPFGQTSRATLEASRRLRKRVPTPRKPPGFDENSLSPITSSSPVKTRLRSINDRIPTPRKPPGWKERNLSPGLLSSPKVAVSENQKNEQPPQSPIEYDRDDTDSEHASQDHEANESNSFDGIQDDTSVLDRSLAESEGFSMVSIESLKNQRRLAEAQPGNELGIERQISPQDHETMEKAVNAKYYAAHGTSHQSGPAETTSDNQVATELERQSPEDPFVDFGNGTKRALSADFAIGELLARGERGFVATQAAANATGSQNYDHDRGEEQETSHRRLPTPSDTASPPSSADKDKSQKGPLQSRTSTRHQHPGLVQHAYDSNGTDATNFPVNGLEVFSHEEPNPDIEEQKWQKEREDVIRQAEEANSSQIIYLSSEHDPPMNSTQNEEESYDVEMTDANDIWKEEADRSLEQSTSSHGSRPGRHVQSKKEIAVGTADLKELLGEDTRPLRSKLPRTWRRISGSHFLYSDEAESPLRPSANAPAPNSAHNPKSSEARQDRGKVASHDQQNEQQPSRRREESPSKGILSSPEKRERERERSSTPKEVRFTNAEPEVQTISGPFADTDYFSSDDSSNHSTASSVDLADEQDEPDHDDVFYEERSYFSDAEPHDSLHVDTSVVCRLREALAAMATPKGRTLGNAPPTAAPLTATEDDAMRILKPDPNRVYEKLFDDVIPTPLPEPKKKKPDPNLAKHIRSSRTISVQVPPTLNAPQEQGIFSRLSAWLYPPLPVPDPQYTYTHDWNRNHYLLLNNLWNLSYKAPYYVEEKTMDQLPPGPSTDNVPIEFEKLVSARITRFSGSDALVLTRTQCRIAAQFTAEAQQVGIPLLCDGRRRVPKHIRKQQADYNPLEDSSESDDDGEEWPKRDEFGRVVRCREEWTAEETVKGVYGLWLIKTKEAEVARANGTRPRYS